jgi:hypothetical protein
MEILFELTHAGTVHSNTFGDIHLAILTLLPTLHTYSTVKEKKFPSMVI